MTIYFISFSPESLLSVLLSAVFTPLSTFALPYKEIYFSEPLSIFARTLYEFITSIIPLLLGFIIGKSNPFAIAKAKNVSLIKSLQGRPNEILETPKRVFTPNSSFTFLTAFNVS